MKTGKKAQAGSNDLDLMPFMNLLITLVPLLLLSAEFSRISVVDIVLPKRGVQTDTAEKSRSPENDDGKLLLTAIITDSALTLGAQSGFLPSIRYVEFHRYKAIDDGSEFSLQYDPEKTTPVRHPKNGRTMELRERCGIDLFVRSEKTDEIIRCLYTTDEELLTNRDGAIMTSVAKGDTVYALSDRQRTVIVKDQNAFLMKNLSVYDELRNRLMRIKERFKNMEDADKIIVAAEDKILYDKIVQIMDVARTTGFPDIAIAKLRS